jgi:spermidine synthase
MLSVSLGHEIVSMLAVVSAFFCGLALGAWLLDRSVSRSAVPGRWYILFEIVIGLWAVVLMFILPTINTFVADVIGVAPSPMRHWTVAFFYPLVILLPATFAMGGTLPAMDRLFERLGRDSFAVGGLYGVNTFGAMAGTFLITFLILPRFGMNKATILLALVNFFVAATAYLLLCKSTSTVRPAGVFWPQNHATTRRLYLTLFITGLVGIGFEVVMTRVLSQLFENTVYSFSAILMVFLFGTAIGALIYQKNRPSISSPGILSFMLPATAFFCLVSIAMLRYASMLFLGLQQFLGGTYYGAIAAELLIALLFFLLPTMAMGVTFSHLAQSLKGQDRGVGRALCLNTLGGAAAPLLFGVVLLPLIGIQYALLLIPVTYILCLQQFRRLSGVAGVTIATLTLYLALGADPYQFITLGEGDTVVSHKEGVMASVSVIEDDRRQLHLKVNNHFQMGGTTSVFSDRRQAYLPLLLHPKPQQALFLGLGTGSTFAAAAVFQELKAEGVELLPEVIQAMYSFEKVTGDFSTFDKLHIINADARRYVTASKQAYDVVIADLFHPARDGAGTLYTLEHFQAIRRLLQEDGLFCQWLPLYQLDLETFNIITRTFLEVFPEGQAFLAHYSLDQPIIGLVGGRQKLSFPENWYDKRTQSKELRRHLSGFGYDSIYSLLGTFLAGGETLRTYVASSPVNTDAHPVVLFQAPRYVYGSPGSPSERLLKLLGDLPPPDPENILAEVVTEEDYLARSRLSAYWAARNSFLELGMKVERTEDVVKLYKTASDPLLAVVRRSVDFSSAYFPLISIAYDLYPHDADASYKLFRDLERANPLRPEAGMLRQRLFVQ